MALVTGLTYTLSIFSFLKCCPVSLTCCIPRSVRCDSMCRPTSNLFTLLSASPWRTKAISGKTIENYKSSLKFVFRVCFEIPPPEYSSSVVNIN